MKTIQLAGDPAAPIAPLTAGQLERLARELVEEARAGARRIGEEARATGLAEGRAEGRADGYRAGREEGYQQGLEQGLREGREEGSRKALEEEEARISSDIAALGATLAGLARALEDHRKSLLSRAREELLPLALSIAGKVVAREVEERPAAVVRNVNRAVELAFRGADLVVQVHPRDAALIERCAGEAWGTLARGRGVTLEPSDAVGRGGCRVVAGPAAVDLDLATQLAVIEEALRGSLDDCDQEEGHPGEGEARG